MEALTVGIDIGTGGVRVAAYAADGTRRADAAQPLRTQRDGPRMEQDPADWWQGAAAGLRAVVAATRGQGEIVAISVAATSGTICLLDAAGRPVRPALMYADRRSEAEAQEINRVCAALCDRLGYAFNSSWGLPKLLWLQRNEPDAIVRSSFVAHAGDVVTGRLSGRYDRSDITQALKTGYDLLDERWPREIQALDLPLDKLPRIIRSGETIGQVTAAAADETGLRHGTAVVAGMTDGCASQIASGAVEPGQWLSVLGTTLVFKGVSADLVRDPQGRIYSHRHPLGFWLPGAASNLGGNALAGWPRDTWDALNRSALQQSPTGLVSYPLPGEGERFPFVAPAARPFVLGIPRSEAEQFAAAMEGVAYVERLGYDLVMGLGARVEDRIFTTGGGTRSAAWNQIRADILDRALEVVAESGAVFGAALLAASATLHPDLATATRQMVRRGTTVEPRPDHRDAYDRRYERFRAACRERGYLADSEGTHDR